MVKIFGIKNCNTMKKAFCFLEEKGIDYEFVDYKKHGVIEEHILDWCRRAEWTKLLNTKGLTWRKLSAAQRENLDQERAMALMITYPTLIKRPVLDVGEGMELLLGFDEALYMERLRNAS